MGAYWNTYLGVYLEVQEGKEKKTHTYYVDSLGVKKNTPFDPNTGDKYQEITEEKESVVYPSPYGFDFADDFFNPEYTGSPKGYVTWIPNDSDYKIAKMEEYGDNPNQEIKEIDIENIKVAFINEYSNQLKAIGEKFNYTVKFGLVYYAH